MDKPSLADVATDFQGLAKLRAGARQQTASARRETAEQFEALFLQTMLKSMRQATPGDPLMGSDQANLYRDMLDQQLALDISKRGGIGLADVIERQLGPAQPETSRQSDPFTRRSFGFAAKLWQGTQPEAAGGPHTTQQWHDRESFVESLMPAAEQAASRLGTRPEAVLAIAALETGWGQHVMPDRQGNSSFNLFGIKADKSWQNGKVMARTLEFESGVMQQKREPFRTYDTAAESVNDFASFILENPRYRSALQVAEDPEQFLRGVHQAGYATDPDYSQKVVSVMRQIQGMTQESLTVADNGI